MRTGHDPGLALQERELPAATGVPRMVINQRPPFSGKGSAPPLNRSAVSRNGLCRDTLSHLSGTIELTKNHGRNAVVLTLSLTIRALMRAHYPSTPQPKRGEVSQFYNPPCLWLKPAHALDRPWYLERFK